VAATERTSFNFCAYGDEGVAEAMRRLEGKSLHGRRVTVARLGALSAIRDCDLLYVGADEAPSLARIVELLGDAPVLTVTDAPPAPTRCGGDRRRGQAPGLRDRRRALPARRSQAWRGAARARAQPASAAS
jgi:hypothetical protein